MFGFCTLAINLSFWIYPYHAFGEGDNTSSREFIRCGAYSFCLPFLDLAVADGMLAIASSMRAASSAEQSAMAARYRSGGSKGGLDILLDKVIVFQ